MICNGTRQYNLLGYEAAEAEAEAHIHLHKYIDNELLSLSLRAFS